MARKLRRTSRGVVGGALLVAAAVLSSVASRRAAAGPEPRASGLAAARVVLRDGARLREVVRTGGTRAGLERVAFRDLASGREAAAWVGRRALVKLAPDADPAALADAGLVPLRVVMPALGLWLVESAAQGEDGLALAARLQRHPSFGRALAEAVPDLYLERVKHGIAVPPNDPRYAGQWFYGRLDMEAAWRLESGRPEVGIAVIDDGCDASHPDLRDKLDPGRDVIDGDDDPSPAGAAKGDNHGTACAGLVAASTDNGLGVAGSCPGCRLRCVRLLAESGGLVPISADVDAFQFVLESGVAIASNSWGFKTATPVPAALAQAIELVHTQGRGGLGTLVVFAAGNDSRLLGDDELNAVRGVITVGAVNNFDEAAQFSNSGPSVDVVAPTGTLTTDIVGAGGADPGDYTASFGGTSSACPIVAGVLGLMVSAAPTKTADELEALLVATAQQSSFARPDSKGHDDLYGYGLVQPAKALQMLVPPAPMKVPSGGCALAASSGRSNAVLVASLVGLLAMVGRRRAGRRP